MKIFSLRLYTALFLAIIGFFLLSSIFPTLHLTYFAPFLILTFYEKDKIPVLWLSLFCGLFLDLFSIQHTFAIFALSYTLTSWLLYHRKPYFFEDSTFTLPLLTFLFSCIETSLHFFLLIFFDKGLPFSWQWVVTDLIAMGAADALFALLWFSLPIAILTKIWRRRRRSYLKRRPK